MTAHIYEHLVIGGGPSGLTFSSRASGSTVVVDMGKPVRDRDHSSSKDIPIGIGGAGCFSDGKFSFFPAGTQVWNLCYHLIAKAYSDLTNDMIDINIPPFPTEEEIKKFFFEPDNYWKLKKYPTIYLGLEERIKLIERLAMKCSRILTQHEVIRIERNKDGAYTATVKSLKTQHEILISAKNIVFAGGRFFPLMIPLSPPIPTIFRRYEFGFRIETSSDNCVLNGDGKYENFSRVIDPKFRYKHNDHIEFRTFCWCRKGEVIRSDYKDLQTFSGRSDITPTNNSNFGFLVRITENIPTFDIKKISSFKFPLKDALSNHQKLCSVFGEYIGNLLNCALQALIVDFPELNNATLIGPSVEGVGEYPDIDHDLKVKGENIYCIGDCSGTFRGLIPSMLSGYYLSHSLHVTL